MSDYASFTKFEHVVVHRYRDRLNHATSTEDVRQCFTASARDLIDQVSGETIPIADDAITLKPHLPQGFEVAPRLIADSSFAKIWNASDLPTILGRMAESATHRYRHLDKRLHNGDAHGFRRER